MPSCILSRDASLHASDRGSSFSIPAHLRKLNSHLFTSTSSVISRIQAYQTIRSCRNIYLKNCNALHSHMLATQEVIIMNQKQIPIANGRPLASSNISQRSGRTSYLPKKKDSSGSCVSPTLPTSALSIGSRTKDHKQAIDTPVRAFLSSNITPRSSSRKARAESASSTPNGTPGGTPNNSRPSSMVYIQDRELESPIEFTSLETRRLSTGRTVRSPSISSDRPATAISYRPPSRERELHSAKASGSGSTPKFFHADDIRPALASIPSERVIEQGSVNGFTNLGGKDDGRTSRVVLSSSPPVDELRPKFFYASDVGESASAPKSSASRTTKAPYPIYTGTSPIANSGLQQQRATSPLKEEIVSRKSSLSKPRRHTRLVSNPKAESEMDIRCPEPLLISQSSISGKSSLKSPVTSQASHARSSSVGAEAPISVRRGSVTWSEGPIVDSPSFNPDAEPEILQAVEQAPSVALEHPQVPTVGKPTLGQSKLDHMNELAANARRERKVLDLEISNSSLLAINRTLEREMRKQSAELRRFRRRSQPGRLSLAPTSRSASNTLSMLSKSDQTGYDSDDLSDVSSPSVLIDDDEDFSDDASDRSPSLNTSRQFSNPLSTSRFPRQRDNEAERMRQDLARHRQLLVDSQKLNESIKRCLGRTGDLIADAKKALDYHVEVGGVETRGGRVLLPDEIEDGEIGQQRQGLLSPGVTDMKSMQRELGNIKKEDMEGYFPQFGAEHANELEKDTVPSPDVHTANIELEQPDISESIASPPIDQSPPQSPLERDGIKTDLQTPNEPPTITGGMQGLKEYLTLLGPSWGL